MHIEEKRITTLRFNRDELIEFLTTARSAQVDSDKVPTFHVAFENGEDIYSLEWYSNTDSDL